MASLKGVYQNFLASPNDTSLNDDASLNYVTTLTTIHPAAALVKHCAAHQKVLKKKEEKTLNAIESDNALCLEVETTIEFVNGGGAYLPGLDDNFLADRIVTFPIVHIVHFDADRKIQTIRLSWDQGSLLKQLDVIGARARSWPIRDGKDQARLIATSAAAAPQSSSIQRPTQSTSKGVSDQSNATTEPPMRESAVSAKASSRPPPRDYGDLFAGDEHEPPRSTSPRKQNHNAVAKASSAKPAPRDYHDIFAGGEEDASPASKGKPSSPLKNITSPGAPKAGAGKNFQPMRLFDNIPEDLRDFPDSPKQSASKYVKPDPNKYNHFDFGPQDDHESAQPQPLSSRPVSSKHQSQWGFEDFMTPNKVPQKIRNQDQRHFGWSDDEPKIDLAAKKGPPKSRPDADPHFEFVDEGTPAGARQPPSHPRGPGGNAKGGLALYKNDLFDDAGDIAPEATGKGRPLATIANLKDRRKDFDPQFGMTDAPSPGANGPAKQFPGHKSAAIQTISANWSASHGSAAPAHPDRTSSNHPFGDTARKGKENFPTAAGHKNIGIMSAGDGMGGKKGSGRSWGFGDDSDGEEQGGQNTKGFRAQRRQQAPAETTQWDF